MKQCIWIILSLLCLTACSTQVECEVCEPCEPIVSEEIVKDDVYYQEIVLEYHQKQLVGTWQLNEHQTFTFNEDGTGSVYDDGYGRLDNVANTYPMTYYFKDYQRVVLNFSMNFETDIVSNTYYMISFKDNYLIIHQNYRKNLGSKIPEDDIVLTRDE